VYAVENEATSAQHHHDNSISGFIDYQELQKSLKQIESNSKGTVQVNVAGQSHEGLDIYTARVGTGDKVLLMQSEIHGNEKTGTVAILNFPKTLSNNSKQSTAIRDDVTIVLTPIMTPAPPAAATRRTPPTRTDPLDPPP